MDEKKLSGDTLCEIDEKKTTEVNFFVELLGDTLCAKDGENVTEVKTEDAVEGKYIGIYFSGHWCGPCRGFTPKLAEYYPTLQEKNLEVIFVSSDKNQTAFDSYYKEMPWLALPYPDRNRKNAISQKFEVRGIPMFVILSPDGEVITKKGRAMISKDPQCKDFPWTPKTLAELLGNKFLSKDGEVDKTAYEGKTLGLYFSAHWCPPCRNFTPKLITTYNALVEKKRKFRGPLSIS